MSRVPGLRRAGATAAACLLAASCALTVPPRPPGAAAGEGCVPVGEWVEPGTRTSIGWRDVVGRAARGRVVLLGERHDRADDHRWQLYVLAALRGAGADLVVGFEMFPRRVQPALDRWVAGLTGRREFLAEVEWERVWGGDETLYLPLFDFARMNRLPMVALNVDGELVRHVGAEGWAAVPAAEREGVGDPARAPDAYVDRLAAVYREKRAAGVEPGDGEETPAHDEPGFRRFVEAQLLWDRAMAEALAAAAAAHPHALVVGIVGRGHAEHGHGIAHQLAALGLPDAAVLLAWDEQEEECARLTPGLADAVFGVTAAEAASQPRLGVLVLGENGGARILAVDEGSVAAVAGLRRGDVIVVAAGRRVDGGGALGGIVRRQAPGTWLPLEVRRGARVVRVVARFPPEP